MELNQRIFSDMIIHMKYARYIPTLERREHGSNANNVSATVNIKAHDWQKVGEWMWGNKASYNGLSVLPCGNGSYKQAPFEDLTQERF